jgi:hypothetical protein
VCHRKREGEGVGGGKREGTDMIGWKGTRNVMETLQKLPEAEEEIEPS